MQIPVVEIVINSTYQNNQLLCEVLWKFDKDMSNQVKTDYDVNYNNKLEDKEIFEIKLALEKYLKENNFLTYFSYIDDNNKTIFSKLDILPKTSLSFEKEHLFYKYSFENNISLKQNQKFEININDVNNLFAFHIKNFLLVGYDGSYTKLYDSSKVTVDTHFKEQNSSKVVQITNSKVTEKTTDSFLKKEFDKIKKSIKNLLQDIKENNSMISYIWLLGFSFLYGMIHAIGPGHGKSLVSAYFLNDDRSILKALNISVLIAVVHTFSAFIMTFTIYYVLNVFLSNYFQDVDFIATKLSAIIIISIALYLLYKKIPKKRDKLVFKISGTNSFVFLPKQKHINNIGCECSACKTTSTDLGVILAAGIVPCAGTVTIFIFTMSLGLYFVGFLSAILMSFGMSFVIFVMAYISIKIRKNSSNNEKLRKILEIGSLIFILILGILLAIS